jgi:hypothetical protein
MRMMLRAVMDTPSGNAVIQDGSIAGVIERLVEQLHPEATYFAEDDGKRACFVVFDMTDSAQLPVISEPMFQVGNARVTITPCMDLADLRRGLGQLAGSAKAPGDGAFVG